MNYLQEYLDKIQGATKDKTIDTIDFFIKIKGKSNHKQMSKIRELIEEYDNFVKYNFLSTDDKEEVFSSVLAKTDEIMDVIHKFKINQTTMNRLIETCLGVMGKTHTDKQYTDATKYMIRTFNILYRADKQMFLSNFKK